MKARHCDPIELQPVARSIMFRLRMEQGGKEKKKKTNGVSVLPSPRDYERPVCPSNPSRSDAR